MMLARTIDTIQRREGGRILAGLIRFCGNFDLAEEALQEAYLRALADWQKNGLPSNAAAWLTRAAQRVLQDAYRKDRRVEPLSEEMQDNLAASDLADPAISIWQTQESIVDDQLRLIFTCCHPALAPTAQTALALKTICQLTVGEIARAYLEPEATTAQRLVRAKRKIAEAHIPYIVPEANELPARISNVLQVIYLVFNEGYTAAHASELIRVDLCTEAIRLATLLNTLLPNHAEAMGLQAMMQLHHARRAARVDANNDLIPLDEQNRALWHVDAISEATKLLDSAVLMRQPGPYQIEAAIASLHCNAKQAADTDWEQISVLYGALWRHRPNDIVALNAAVAHAMAFSIDEGLARIDSIAKRGELAHYHLLHAARADLLRRKGDINNAKAAYAHAILLCNNDSEKRFLEKRLLSLDVANITPNN